MDLDREMMSRAVELARARVGLTAQNPAVGCVLVRDGVIVGEAATAEGGSPHAEEQAIDQAGVRARGSTAYVTLEPCAARSAGSASCSERLRDAGVVRVVVACADASTLASGRGIARLAEAGIAVETGLLEPIAQELYRNYRPRQ